MPDTPNDADDGIDGPTFDKATVRILDKDEIAERGCVYPPTNPDDAVPTLCNCGRKLENIADVDRCTTCDMICCPACWTRRSGDIHCDHCGTSPQHDDR